MLGKFVCELEDVPYIELLKWLEYFKMRPVGWREDSRTYKLMQAFGVKEKPEGLFDSLRTLRQQGEQASDVNRTTSSFTSSAMYQKILSAKGGDKIGN